SGSSGRCSRPGAGPGEGAWQDPAMEGTSDLHVPMTLRNRNYLRAAWFSLGVALVILAINLPSSFALGWLGITLVVIPGTTAILSLAVWWRSSLRVRADGVTIGSLLHQHV